MKKLLAILLCSASLCGAATDWSDPSNWWWAGSGGGGSFPAQNDLIQWLSEGSDSSFPSVDRVGLYTLPTISGTNYYVQTSFVVALPSVTLGGNYVPYLNTVSDRPNYNDASRYAVNYSGIGSNWRIYNDTTTWTNTVTTTFPPLTGTWTLHSGADPFVALAYSSFWVETNEFATNSYADIIGHVSGTDGVVWKTNSAGIVTDILTYSDSSWTLPEWLSIAEWANAASGTIVEVAYDLDGSPQINEDGSVELVQP